MSPRTSPTSPASCLAGSPSRHYGVTSLADLGRAATHGRSGRGAAGGVRGDVRADRRRPRGGLTDCPASSDPMARPRCRSPPHRWRAGRSGPAPTRGRRLGTERAHALAPLHYALVGERRGFRPNGFFDPDFFRRSAGPQPASRRSDGALSCARSPTPPPLRPNSITPGTRRRTPTGAVITRIRSCIFSRPVWRTGRRPTSRHRHGVRARRDPRQRKVDGGSGDARVRPQASRQRHEAAAEP